MDDLNNSSPKRRVAIYIRVSTQEQNIDGYSLEAQRKKLLEHIKNNQGLNLMTKPEWIYEDVHTGSDLSRPELNRLREGVKRGDFDAVLVWKIDRLSRSLKHLLTLFEEFEDHEVSFISVQENIDFRGPIGKLIFQIFGAIAQFERELIKGRTHMGIVASAEMGNYTGSAIPYGYKPVKNKGGKGKKLQIIKEEKKWVERMFEWYVYEDMGFLQIANKLTELKVPKGQYEKVRNKYSKWKADKVGKIIKNSLYRGEYVANRKDEQGNELPLKDWTIVEIPPCVSEFVFQQAQKALETKKGGWSKNQYILSGKLRDITVSHKQAFVGAKRNKGGFSYRRKQFTDKDGVYHQVFEVPAKQIDEYVIARIQEALVDPQIFIEKYLAKKYTSKTQIQKLEDQLDNLRLQKANAYLSLGRVEDAYERGDYSEEKLQEKSTNWNKEIGQIESKIKEFEDDLTIASTLDVEIKKLKEASKQMKYKLENLTIKQKQILVSLFVDRIEMKRVKDGKRWKVSAEIFFRFNPAKVKSDIDRVRTRKALKLKDNPSKIPNESDSGATNGN